ncbi:hypothetical protein, variant 2 [Aphanomyces astaci]|nr:hypothetical protein, variant 2 [Aphanomyces astaci]ETV71629.1 hypothetical protein, variant 2 [Aphanomyces astaci]|eukprot:XP_009838815.1 hypothetical protein, variant 2 [Aphanomyces astaci]
MKQLQDGVVARARLHCHEGTLCVAQLIDELNKAWWVREHFVAAAWLRFLFPSKASNSVRWLYQLRTVLLGTPSSTATFVSFMVSSILKASSLKAIECMMHVIVLLQTTKLASVIFLSPKFGGRIKIYPITC